MALQKTDVRSILVIDDDKDDFELVTEAMKEISPDISVYYLGRCEEVAGLKDKTFDLVLLDINMPQNDGFSWLHGIRERGYKMPVIMYTNSLSPVHIARSYEEGANLFFSKPESYSYLIKSLDALVHLDWSEPHSVTRTYRKNGQYQVFKPE